MSPSDAGDRPAPPAPDAQRFGVYRKLKGRTGVGMLYQFLMLAREHTTGAESVVYIPLRIEPEWAGTIRPCILPRDQFNNKFEFVSEGLPLAGPDPPVAAPVPQAPLHRVKELEAEVAAMQLIIKEWENRSYHFEKLYNECMGSHGRSRDRPVDIE